MQITGLESGRAWHRPLLVTVAVMAGLVVAAAIGLVVDGRTLGHEAIWAKPLKFGMSFVIYGLTLAWLLPQLQRARRTMWALGTLFAVTGIVDVGFIALQAARGTYSHFNVDETDLVNVVGQQVFSSGVIGLFGVSLAIAVAMLWQRIGDKGLTRALRAGIGLAVLGMVVAFSLVPAAGEWTAVDASGRPVPMSGGHGLAVPDGGGMPVTNWSTVGGDLRVPHFIGLHAVQVFVLAVVVLAVLARRVPWLQSERTRAALVGAVVIGYGGQFAVTAWQAARGQSLIHPDAATLLAAAAVLALAAAAATVTIVRARRRMPEADARVEALAGR
ncbi:hypothetical protein ACQEVB_21910 [Pseudonocardia sp. CA-107938]|uniref:hypothetical protein n=1 Tax=Pseudonocardia sp. CA-107938 TaxID=3240021 RepID=UPI003D8D0808